jgi:hypothetical protein
MGASDQLEPIERAGEDGLAALQLARLKATIAQAYARSQGKAKRVIDRRPKG